MAIILGLIGLIIYFIKRIQMSHLKKIGHKIFRYKNLINQVESWKNLVINVFTMDVLTFFRGHIEYLLELDDLGDKLIVGLNSDNSIQKIKGNSRPIDEDSRALLLATLSFVDAVILFLKKLQLN